MHFWRIVTNDAVGLDELTFQRAIVRAYISKHVFDRFESPSFDGCSTILPWRMDWKQREVRIRIRIRIRARVRVRVRARLGRELGLAYKGAAKYLCCTHPDLNSSLF